jgi:transitional endoplasmic reticulum ATPase
VPQLEFVQHLADAPTASTAFSSLPPPDREARESILRLQLAEQPVLADIDVAALAKSTSSYSGADLCNLVETTCDLAMEESLGAGTEKPVTRAHLQAALK